jgi:hypothetical protein
VGVRQRQRGRVAGEHAGQARGRIEHLAEHGRGQGEMLLLLRRRIQRSARELATMTAGPAERLGYSFGPTEMSSPSTLTAYTSSGTSALWR